MKNRGRWLALGIVALGGCAESHEAACAEAVEGPAKIWLYVSSTEGCPFEWHESDFAFRCADVTEACGAVYGDCDELEVAVAPDGQTEAIYTADGRECALTGARIVEIDR